MPSLAEFVEQQRALEEEASEALPWSFSQCTHSLGYIRQPVFLCQTCASPHGICAACSIACHGDHEQTELFPKRAFRCDCPTSALSRRCTLHNAVLPPNIDNKYNQNYQNKFCRCDRPYIASEERETMIQCVACEDWFHESCLNLRDRPNPHSSEATNRPATDDAASDVTDELPPPLLPEDQYDSLICGDCVNKSRVLKTWAGTPMARLVVRETNGNWKVVPEQAADGTDDALDVGDEPETSVSVENGLEEPHGEDAGNVLAVTAEPPASEAESKKRPHTPSFEVDDRPPKKARSLCHAPSPSPVAKSVLWPTLSGSSLESAGDIFLTAGWRSRWCRCPTCLPGFEGEEYLLQEEETYEPPEDPDSGASAGVSIEELGMRALERLPRDKVIDGIHKFNEMTDEFKTYLRTFAEADKEVKAEDIQQFFDAKRKGRSVRLMT